MDWINEIRNLAAGFRKHKEKNNRNPEFFTAQVFLANSKSPVTGTLNEEANFVN